MARARNLKPGFFLNEELAEIEPLGRILFQGLWCIADRRGRLQDRPKRIKIEVLPYDDADVDALLDVLSERGFLIRYGSGNERYIQIVNFEKHQNPHKNETDSTIPAPEDFGTAPESHGTSTVQEPEQHVSTHADSLNLVTDSLNRIPSTRTADKPRSKPSPAETPAALVDAYCQARGQPFPDDAGPFVNIAKSLQKRGYTSTDVDGCTRYLLTDPYWEPILTFKILASQLPDWVQNGRPEKVPANKRNGKATEPDFSGIEGFSETMSALEQRR